MATGANGIATRKDVNNNILSGAFTSDLDKCVAINEIFNHEGLQYNGNNSTSQLALYSKISAVTTGSYYITMYGPGNGFYFSQPSSTDFIQHIFAMNNTVLSTSSALNYNSYTFSYQGDQVQLRFNLPSDFFANGSQYSIVKISFLLGRTGGGSFSAAPTAGIYSGGSLIASNTGSIASNMCTFNIGIGAQSMNLFATALENNVAEIRFS